MRPRNQFEAAFRCRALSNESGVPMMETKRVLDSCDWNVDQAREILRAPTAHRDRLLQEQRIRHLVREEVARALREHGLLPPA